MALPACTVYVGGLGPATSPDSLAACFQPLCAMHAVVMRSFGFVTFSSVGEAQQAAERQDLLIDDRPVHAALSHSRRGVSAAGARPSGRQAGACRSVFVHHMPKRIVAMAVQRMLSSACSRLASEPVRVTVPRKHGGAQPAQHRGFAFVECASAADAAAVLAGLQPTEWRAEPVRKPKTRGDGKGGKGTRGRRRGGRRSRGGAGRRGGGGEQEATYEDDFEEEGGEEEEEQEGGAGEEGEGEDDAAHVATMVVAQGEQRSEATEDSGADEEATDGGGGDACIQAMAAFVSESREWALGVQGFLLEHCRAPAGTFEPTEENRLEWHELHAQLQAMVEGMLERQLAQLGVSVDDFVARLQACPESREGNDLLETVLSMDDFGSFKAQMLRLRADLELLHLPDGTLNEFAPTASRA